MAWSEVGTYMLLSAVYVSQLETKKMQLIFQED